MTHQFDPDAEGAYAEPAGRGWKQQASMVGAGVLAVVLVIFILSNTDSTEVSWLGFEGTAPLWLALLGAAVAGVLLWPLVRAVVRSAQTVDRSPPSGAPGDGKQDRKQ